MPPKKKDAGGKAAAEDVEPDEEEKELIERELVISYLKSKLGRYQLQGERLQVENIKLTQELDNQKANLRDINEFLTNELQARSITTTTLEQNIAELQGKMEQQKSEYEAEISKLKEENVGIVQTMEKSIHDYEKKTRGIQEFLDKKEQLESELAELKDTLDKKEKEFERNISDMERQHIQDKEKWKREMAQKIKETKTHMMKLTDNQLEITTKRTIMENEQMSSELAYQSRQTEKLLQKNQQLFDDNSDMRREMELARQTQEELAKRNFVYQKTISTLLSKMKNHELQKQEDEGVMMELSGEGVELKEMLRVANMHLQDKEEQMGRLEELSLTQRERALEYLLGKFYMQHGADLEEAIHANENESAPSSPLLRLPSIGVDGKSWDPLGMPPYQDFHWSSQPIGYANALYESTDVHRRVVSKGVQTQPLGLDNVEDLAGSLLGGVRNWGKKSMELQSSVRGKETFLRKNGRAAASTPQS
ncbi:hypothetical protein BSKO_10537 [Bryopsis sp. KO-2023]|nr:hypothetical protein BSKO_10537 [Bryopsis sp. KO-2023]